ncbi:MAG: squalene/phytoene synthase family protein [Gammaproteobacteria bacterium]
MQALEYCRNRAAPRGSSLHYALLGVEGGFVARTLALHALVEEILHTVESNTDAGVAHRLLAWWLEELDNAGAGTPTHPVTRLLIERELEPRRLTPVVLAAETVLRERGCASFEALETYGAHTLGIAIELSESGELAHVTPPGKDNALRELGVGLMLARALFELPRRDGRAAALLPRDVLQAHGVAEAALYADRASPQLRAYTRAHIERAQQRLHSCRDALAPSATAGVLAAMSLAALRKLRRRSTDPLRRGAGITPLHKLWIAWRLQGARR